jgi:HK97 family phage prohead protease
MKIIVHRTPMPVCTPRIIVHRRRSESTAPAIIIHRAPQAKRFTAAVEIDIPAEKKVEIIRDAAGLVLDYRNVNIRGYLSTFRATTERDRQGDYVEPGAFRDTIAKFMRNPVLLTDHRNSVGNLAGHFVAMREDKTGLLFEAVLSNAPGVTDVRFKIVEGMLRSVSMGGVFHYKDDGHGIFKVDLWEGSLTPIPANPDARFVVRALNESNATN